MAFIEIIQPVGTRRFSLGKCKIRMIENCFSSSSVKRNQ